MALKKYRVIQSQVVGPLVTNVAVMADIYADFKPFASITCSYNNYTIESFNNTYLPELKIDIETSEFCN